MNEKVSILWTIEESLIKNSAKEIQLLTRGTWWKTWWHFDDIQSLNEEKSFLFWCRGEFLLSERLHQKLLNSRQQLWKYVIFTWILLITDCDTFLISGSGRVGGLATMQVVSVDDLTTHHLQIHQSFQLSWLCNLDYSSESLLTMQSGWNLLCTGRI